MKAKKGQQILFEIVLIKLSRLLSLSMKIHDHYTQIKISVLHLRPLFLFKEIKGLF